MWVTELTDGGSVSGALQFFDFLEIVGIDVFIEKVKKKKKCKELVSGESRTHSARFSY